MRVLRCLAAIVLLASAVPAQTPAAAKATIDSARVDLRRYCRTSKPVTYLCTIDTLRLARASAALVAPTPTPTPVPTPVPVDTTKPAPIGTRVALSVIRIDTTATAATVLVSNGIPLAPGMLKAAQLANVRVLVGGVEQSIYIEPLKSTHRDSSLRSVLVQFNSTVKRGAPLSGELVIGSPRTTPALAKATGSRAQPQAVALPSDPSYLVTTELVGPMITSAATTAAGGVYAKYESDFATYADQHWSAAGSQWAENYYDRAAIYYMQWARTGNPEFWRRATEHALAYRRDYLEAGNYQASAYWLQDEGIGLHYLATGDSVSWFTVGRLAQQFVGCTIPNPNCYIGELTGYMDVRNQARILQSIYLALRYDSPGDPNIGVTDWAAALAKGTDEVLATQQADGGYKSQMFCNGAAPYQVGLLNDQWIKQFRYWKADPRLKTSVINATHWLWSTQWIDAASGFHYTSVNCPDNGMGTAVGGLEPAPDLTGMLSLSFGWTAQQTGDATDASRARSVFANAVAGGYLVSSKQFNEAYTSSPLSLGLFPMAGPLAVSRTAARTSRAATPKPHGDGPTPKGERVPPGIQAQSRPAIKITKP